MLLWQPARRASRARRALERKEGRFAPKPLESFVPVEFVYALWQPARHASRARRALERKEGRCRVLPRKAKYQVLNYSVLLFTASRKREQPFRALARRGPQSRLPGARRPGA